jgi:hypothetical protein
MAPARILLTSLAGVVLLAGCHAKQKSDADASASDPALTGALGDQIMVDPNLTGQGKGAVAANPEKIELPPEQRSPEAISAAKAEAAKMAGGLIKSAPPAANGGINPLVETAATAAQVADAAKTAKTDCSQKVRYSMSWVTQLPDPLAVYPRGAVQEAAGTDSDGCKLRVVTFVTPVTPGDVMDFYYTRLHSAGYSAQHKIDGRDQVLGGSKDAKAYLVFARKADNGLTEVDLVASGS